jgi:FkbM family methyltransferase
MSHKLTVVITCKNEAKNIGGCIVSARQIADEVLVADSGSTDGTLDIIRELGCRLVEREYITCGDFRNWAIPQAQHEWVFILDADERITPKLAAEIRAVLLAPKHDGYWIKRRNFFLGHPLRFGPWKNDRCLRLFRRDLGRYNGVTDHVHAEIASGNVGRLREIFLHYTSDSYSQFLPKLSRYAMLQARAWEARGKRVRTAQLLVRFPLRFLQCYIWRLGILDGLAGLQVAVLVAYQSWLKQAYLFEYQRAINWHDQDAVDFPVSAAASNPNVAALTADLDNIRPTAHTTLCTIPSHPRRRGLRELRHRLTPSWLRTDARRRARNVFFRRFGIQRCHTPPIVTRSPELTIESQLPFVVAHELLTNPRLTFLQIGAFDGVCNDDLRHLIQSHRLRGVLVEPQPSAFAKLQQTYRNQPNVTLLQAAIAEEDGQRDLFCKRGEASMAASFERSHLKKHGIRDTEIVVEQVRCLTISSALAAAGMQTVDLIQIDAEGYDWPIIRSIDFTKLRPRILRFEYSHMTSREADECLSLLASNGYRFVIEARDIIAVQSAQQSSTLSTLMPAQRLSA